jgi:hypothetical protein
MLDRLKDTVSKELLIRATGREAGTNECFIKVNRDLYPFHTITIAEDEDKGYDALHVIDFANVCFQ